MDCGRHAVQTPAPLVILLDTNALIWLDQGHARTRALTTGDRRLYVSPVSLLELQFLIEADRIRLRHSTVAALASREGFWMLDDPPATQWFEAALDLGWTRDPFDRLLVAHARLRRWRLATADDRLLNRLSERERLAL
jgi:PIN domain nuclease of toxin-antitoxin system